MQNEGILLAGYRGALDDLDFADTGQINSFNAGDAADVATCAHRADLLSVPRLQRHTLDFCSALAGWNIVAFVLLADGHPLSGK
jgi:hypothetical protein